MVMSTIESPKLDRQIALLWGNLVQRDGMHTDWQGGGNGEGLGLQR